MHDPKFEKEVQQKLQELSFSPSEAVWSNIDRAVNGEKKRRVPVFWLFLLPALTLTGMGVVYFSARTSTAHKNIVKSTVVAPTVAPPAASTGTTGTTATTATARTTPTTGSTQPSRDIPAEGRSGHSPEVVHNGHPSADGYSPAGGHNTSIHSVNRLPIRQRDMTDNAPEEVRQEVKVRTEELPQHPMVVQTAPATAITAERANLPGLNVFDHHFSVTAAGRLSSRSRTAAVTTGPIQLKPKYTWEAGFAGGIGMSSLNRTLFQQPSAVASDVRQNTNTSTAITGAPKAYTSKIQPDLSYWAGIVVQRPLDKRFTLSLGLSLHYYSTKIQVGEKVVAPSSYYYTQSLFTTQAPQAQANVYPYYSVGDNDIYTNRYYFLELPGSILWQVNHSRNLPLFWEGGFSLAYLVSSNALYYNSKSTTFYKDGSMTNKTQLNLATALLVGLPIKGMRLQAGPQVQYGVTSLQNNGGTNGQHLFYGGLRVVLLPGKAKK
ncbi:MAG: hypothetical protein J0H74_04930 [Chitinophagaceae bacterium]|nr:hypothetical protein [Chitinophagaceae bacterium]